MSESFECSLTLERFKHPVVLVECGHSFEKYAIEECIKKKSECPECRTPITTNAVTNWALVKGLSLDIGERTISKSISEKVRHSQPVDKNKRSPIGIILREGHLCKYL